MSVDTCKSVETDSGLHASNPSRRLLECARGGTLEILGPCEGTLIAADGGNETIAVGGSDDIVVVVAMTCLF